MDDWTDQLNALYEQDKEHQEQAQAELNLSLLNRPTPADILRDLEAMKLLRSIQSLLLRGGGTLDVYERDSEYDRAITLVWQGPVSKARRPNPEDDSDYYFIAIGVKGSNVYVNDKQVKNPAPDTLKKALLAAAKKPGRQKNIPGKNE